MHEVVRTLAMPFWRRYKEIMRRRLLRSMPSGGVVAEIGVWEGNFSKQILDVNRPKELHLVDPWRYRPDYPSAMFGDGVAGSQEVMDTIASRVEDRFADYQSVQIHRTTSVAASEQFADGMFDWIYIDGDHTYEAVLDDLTAWLPKVRNGGWVVGDDYMDGGWWDGGVKRAVDEVATLRTDVMLVQVVARQCVLQVDR